MIRVIAVGRLKDPHLAAAVDGYVRRLRGLTSFAMVELRDEGPEREAEAMLRRLGSPAGHGLVVALDERGDELDSRQFATLMSGHGAVDFLVGGPDGLGAAAWARAGRAVRLTALTLPHELARLVLIEQIYRGLTILRGHAYHRD